MRRTTGTAPSSRGAPVARSTALELLRHPADRSERRHSPNGPPRIPTIPASILFLLRAVGATILSFGGARRPTMRGPDIRSQPSHIKRIVSPPRVCASKGAMPPHPQVAWRAIGRLACLRSDPLDAEAVPSGCSSDRRNTGYWSSPTLLSDCSLPITEILNVADREMRPDPGDPRV